jgi:hypothetical protein
LSIQARIASLEEQLEYIHRERQAGSVSTELESRLSSLEERYETLEVLDVVANRLESARNRKSANEGILEIAAAIIGSEEVALYEVEKAGQDLRLAAWCGVEPDERVPVGAGIIGQTAKTCREYFAPPPAPGPASAAESRISVCIPLFLESVPVWVLVIYAMLPQKQLLAKRDIEILHFLRDHAVSMLGCQSE